jgi:hypothetical protein
MYVGGGRAPLSVARAHPAIATAASISATMMLAYLRPLEADCSQCFLPAATHASHRVAIRVALGRHALVSRRRLADTNGRMPDLAWNGPASTEPGGST